MLTICMINFVPAQNQLCYYSPNCINYTNPPYGCMSPCEAAYVIPANPTIWTGAIDNNWFNPANWTLGVPAMNSNVWIPSGLAKYPTILLPGAVCDSIWIRNGASILGNANLLIDGRAFVERYVNHVGFPEMHYWHHCNWMNDQVLITWPSDIHYLSSPVPNALDNTVEQDAVFQWEEPVQTWVPLWHPCSDSCFGPPFIWIPGKGYSVAPNDNWWCQTTDCPIYNTPPGFCTTPWKCQRYREFIDNELNHGEFTVNLTSVAVPGGIYPPGWNLLGNPYPSAIDWSLTPSNNVYINSACMWCDSLNAYVYIAGEQNFIPIIQGFMVQAAGPGAWVNFVESARLHNNNKPLYKNSHENFLTIDVSNNGDAFKDKTFIHFNAEAGNELDLLDGMKLGNGSGVPMIYTVLADNTSLAYNSLQSLQSITQVPVHLIPGVTGVHTIQVNGIETFNANAPFFLEDKKLSVVQDLRVNSAYTFDAVPADDPARFILHFAPVGMEQYKSGEINIYSFSKNVIVDMPVNVNGTASIINMLGDEILSAALRPGQLNKISVPGSTGYYIVRVISSGTVTSQKIFIN